MHVYCTGIARRRSHVHARVALQACFESRLFMNASILAAAAVPGVCRVQSGVFTRSSRPVVRFSAFLTGSQRGNFFFSPSKFFFFEGSGPGAGLLPAFPRVGSHVRFLRRSQTSDLSQFSPLGSLQNPKV